MDINKLKKLFLLEGNFSDNGINHREANEFISENYYVDDKFKTQNIKVEFINSDVLVKWYYKPHTSAGKFYRGENIPDNITVNQFIKEALITIVNRYNIYYAYEEEGERIKF